MSGEVATAALGGWKHSVPAQSLLWRDRGRTAAIETPSAVYAGVIQSIIFHMSGDIQVRFQRDESESVATVGPDVLVYFADREAS